LLFVSEFVSVLISFAYAKSEATPLTLEFSAGPVGLKSDELDWQPNAAAKKNMNKMGYCIRFCFANEKV
jgi:hypothetical protein